MQFALLIYHSPEEFAMRKNDYSDPHLGAWRAYYKALVEAKVDVGANALELPETGTTVRVKEGKRRIQDGPYADTKEQLAGFIIMELPSLDAALEWAARCPASALGAVEVRPVAIESVARESYGRLVAFLCARTRDVAGAEDALGEALVAALATWPREGTPK